MASLMPQGKQQYFDSNGNPLAGGRVYTYESGTSTPLATYSDQAGAVPNANPVVLNARGEATIFWGSAPYKVALKDASDVEIWTQDNLQALVGVADLASTAATKGAALVGFDGGTLAAYLKNKSAQVVDSITALKAIDKTKFTRAFVTGYYAAGDGGGGDYWFDSTDTTSTDNGGTVIVATDGGRWKLIHLGEVSLKQFGAKIDGATADNTAIQAAIDSGLALFMPPGTAILTLSQNITLEGGATVCALKAKTRLRLRGAGMHLSILKIKDNESTDASPKYFNLMASNEVLDGVEISDIGFDLNGANNPISPDRGSGTYNLFNCAALMVSGSVGTVGVDARMTNSKIIRCQVYNSPGVTCIAVGQSNAAGYTLGNNIEIAHCRFYNNGLDTNDHSSVYMWADNVNVHHCDFDHPSSSSGTEGPYAAAELHGSRNFFTHNTVRNYPWGVYVAGNLTSVARGQFVTDNDFIVAQKAVICFNETVGEPGMADIHVSRNHIHLTELHTLAAVKRCLDFFPSQGNVDGVTIAENTIYTTDTYGAYAIAIGALAVGRGIFNVKISENIIKGFSTPVLAGAAGAGAFFDLDISRNTVADMKANTTSPTITLGVYVVGANGRLSIFDNIISGVASHPNIGIYLDAGTLDDLHMGGNVVDKDAAAAVSDNVTVNGRRSGQQATTFAALPAQSTWKIGDIAHNSAISELGVAPNKYIIEGWARITDGTGNVLNTDWLQRRALTGN